MKNKILVLLCCLSPMFSFSQRSFFDPKPPNYEKDLKKINRLIKKEKYEKALTKLDALIENFPKKCEAKSLKIDLLVNKMKARVEDDFIFKMMPKCSGAFTVGFASKEELLGLYELDNFDKASDSRITPSRFMFLRKDGKIFFDDYIWFRNIVALDLEFGGKRNYSAVELIKNPALFIKHDAIKDILFLKWNPCIMSSCGFIAKYKKIDSKYVNQEVEPKKEDKYSGLWKSSADFYPSKIEKKNGDLIWYKNRGPAMVLTPKGGNKYEAAGEHLSIKYLIKVQMKGDEMQVLQSRNKKFVTTNDTMVYHKVSKMSAFEKSRLFWLKGLPYIKTNNGCLVGLFCYRISDEELKQDIFARWTGKCDKNGFATGQGILTFYQSNKYDAKYEGILEYGVPNGKGCYRYPGRIGSDCGIWFNSISPNRGKTSRDWGKIRAYKSK